MLEHGGRLRRAAEDYGIALADWVDLSTGISPWAYPVPPVPEAVWQRLPEDDDGLDAAAARYYGSAELLAVAGSQPAIQALPAVLPGARVGVLAPGYAEHWETTNIHSLATVLVNQALLRQETRGSHWREDFPERDDERWQRRIVTRMASDGSLSTRTIPIEGDR